MKTETLEALLIDRALGVLAPEVGELLETHLAANPDAARNADNLAETVRLARAATAGARTASDRPVPIERFRTTLRTQRRQALIWDVSKLAACLVLGLALGSISQSGMVPANVTGNSAAAIGLPADRATAGVAAERNGFWSLANFARDVPEHAASGVSASSRFRLHWDSPVKMPHLEENL
jgi:anti-sigma factor RsiW